MKTLLVIGFGLIGSSVARAARERLSGVEVSVMDTDPQAIAAARREGFSDASKADLTVVCAPIAAIAGIFQQLKTSGVVTDVASVKAPVAEMAHEGMRFIPGHPIAGSEQAGFAAGRADLFVGKKVVLCPEGPEADGLSVVVEFWKGLGAQVEFMPAELHDQVYAHVSHLPQLIAFACRDFFVAHGVRHESEIFARFSRLWQSDARLWDGIFEANKAQLNSALKKYLNVLHKIISELTEGMSNTQAIATDEVIYGVLLPRILASAMVSTAYQLERELGVPMARFAGTGFKDFTAPAAAPAEGHLESISNHAAQVVDALKEFAAKLGVLQ